MIIDTPESFFDIIPNNIKENLEFRKKMAELTAGDKSLQKTILEMVSLKPQIAFNLLLWTYNPRNKTGFRHLPFILRPHQDLAVDRLKDAIDNQHDELWEKSRDEGATELISKYFALEFILHESGSYLVGSRKEDYVDGSTAIDLLNKMGYLGRTIERMEVVEEKKDSQVQDLGHQKPEETDNLQKSARPSDDYMDSHGLSRETHGKKEDEKGVSSN